MWMKCNNWKLSCTSLFILSVINCCRGARSSISLQNNQYSGLVIAIAEEIPENDAIINGLKDYFIKASEDLFIASNRRAYFKNITVVIPTSWKKKKQYLKAATESFKTANVIIDKAKGLQSQRPYVKQYKGCGESGQYMHLTPKFLVDKEFAAQSSGSVGKTIVSLFGRLRWGVFDEQGCPDIGYPYFYLHSSGQVEATRCSRAITGTIRHKTPEGKLCSKDGLPGESCIFYPDGDVENTKTSLLYNLQLDNVSRFCDGDHNDEAPNMQNRVCKGKSAWEVMRQHHDFLKGKNPAVPIAVLVDARPVFHFVQQQQHERIIIALDVSESMTEAKLRDQSRAVTAFIESMAKTGDSVGILKYQRVVSELHPLTKITDANHRQDLIRSLPTSAEGGCCVGCALQKALQMLESAEGGIRGSRIVLFNDGEENIPPWMVSFIPEMSRKGVMLDALLYSQEADDKILSVATDTMGSAFIASDSPKANNLLDSIAAIAMSGRFSDLVQIMSESATLDRKSVIKGQWQMDSTAGRNTTMYISYNTTTPGFQVVVKSPSGKIYKNDGSGSFFKNTPNLRQLKLLIPGTAEVGEWNFTITSTSQSAAVVLMHVLSHTLTQETNPIKVRASLSNSEIDLKESPVKRVAIYVEVLRGYSPVVGATVEVHIERDLQGLGISVVKQTLLDNGAGADVHKDDGVYSGYFAQYTGRGKHSVRVKVVNRNGHTLLFNHFGGQTDYTKRTKDSNVREAAKLKTPVEKFERVAVTGILNVLVSPGEDNYPPADITDLSVTEVSFDNAEVTLQWTAVGDDLDFGTAKRYIIRYSQNIKHLRKNSRDAVTIQQRNILKGNLASPKKSGFQETVIIQVPKQMDKKVLHFVVYVLDDTDKQSGTSNVATAQFFNPRPRTTQITEITTNTRSSRASSTISVRSTAEITRSITKSPAVEVKISGSPTSKTKRSAKGGISLPTIGGIVAAFVTVITTAIVVVIIMRSRWKKKRRGLMGDDTDSVHSDCSKKSMHNVGVLSNSLRGTAFYPSYLSGDTLGPNRKKSAPQLEDEIETTAC